MPYGMVVIAQPCRTAWLFLILDYCSELEISINKPPKMCSRHNSGEFPYAKHTITLYFDMVLFSIGDFIVQCRIILIGELIRDSVATKVEKILKPWLACCTHANEFSERKHKSMEIE